MPSSIVRKGWCPSLHRPMKARDGLLVRVSPPHSLLTSRQLLFLADAMVQWGNAKAQLTTGANLQLRGFDALGAERFQRAAFDYALGDPDPRKERHRCLVCVSPLAGIDPACADATRELGEALRQSLAWEKFEDRLPAKFSIGVDGGGVVPAGYIRADVMIQSVGDKWRIILGKELPQIANWHDVPHLVEAGIESYLARKTKRRLLHDAAPPKSERPNLVGALAFGWWGLGVPFGLLTPSMLRELGEATERVVVTPWRIIASPTSVASKNFISDPLDPRLRIAACPGKNGCSQGQNDGLADAAFFAERLPPGIFLHVSGCKKGCAHATIADYTAVATAGGYELILNGRADDAPVLHGMSRERLRDTMAEN